MKKKKEIILEIAGKNAMDFELYHVNDSLLNYRHIHPVIAENQILLLQYDLYEFLALSLNSSHGFGEPFPVFKTGDHRYFALIHSSNAYRPESGIFTISRIKYGDLEIDKDKYDTFQNREFVAIEIDLTDLTVDYKTRLTIQWTIKFESADTMTEIPFQSEYTFTLPE